MKIWVHKACEYVFHELADGKAAELVSEQVVIASPHSYGYYSQLPSSKHWRLWDKSGMRRKCFLRRCPSPSIPFPSTF